MKTFLSAVQSMLAVAPQSVCGELIAAQITSDANPTEQSVKSFMSSLTKLVERIGVDPDHPDLRTISVLETAVAAIQEGKAWLRDERSGRHDFGLGLRAKLAA